MMHGGAVEALVAGKGHVRDHLEGRGHHLGKDIDRPLGRDQPPRARLGSGAHHRPQRLDMALGKGRGGGQALPAPMRTLGHEHRTAHRRSQDQPRHQRLGIVLDAVLQHHAQRLGIHDHVPALAGLARDHGLAHSDLGDQLQHIAPRHHGRGQHPKRLAVQGHADGKIMRQGHAPQPRPAPPGSRDSFSFVDKYPGGTPGLPGVGAEPPGRNEKTRAKARVSVSLPNPKDQAAAFACATTAAKASGSCTARSARTLRSTSIPAFASAAMKRE